MAFREVSEWKFSQPIFIGDTVHVELHMLDGAGFFLGGTYTRLFADLEYQYAEGQGGLMFAF